MADEEEVATSLPSGLARQCDEAAALSRQFRISYL